MYVGICIYLYAVVKKSAQKLPVLGQTSVQSFLKEINIYHLFGSKICPIMLRNILEQIFHSTLDRFLTQPVSHVGPFFPSQDMLKPLFHRAFSKITFL